MANKVKIFVIDDDPWLREGLSNWLQEEGYEVWPIATGEEALQRLQNDEVDIIFTDLKMPGLGGMEVLKHRLWNNR